MNFDEIKARTEALRHLNPQGYQEFVVAALRDREQLVDYIESLRGTDVCPHCDKNYPHQHFIDRKGYASDRGTDDSWLCVCGLTVKKRYHCMCGGREDNSRAERFANDAAGKQ